LCKTYWKLCSAGEYYPDNPGMDATPLAWGPGGVPTYRPRHLGTG